MNHIQQRSKPYHWKKAVPSKKIAKPKTECWKNKKHSETKPPPCEHCDLIVACEHNGRNIKLSSKGENAMTMLEIVAGPQKSPDKISCNTNIMKGPCAEKHKNKVFDFSEQTPAPLVKTDNQLQFNANSFAIDFWKDGWLNFLWPDKPNTKTYEVNVHTCEGVPLTAYVRAYPDIHWYAGARFHINTTTNSQLSNPSPYSHTQKFAPEGYFKYEQDGGADKLDLVLSKKQEWQTFFTILNTIDEIEEFTRNQVTNAVGASVDFEMAFGLEGDWAWQEVPDKPTCEYVFSIGFVADPLLGITVTLDVTNVLIQNCFNVLFPGLGTALVKGKNAAEKGVAGNKIEAKIELSINGKIEGELKFDKPLEKKLEAHGKITGKIEAKLEGKLEGTVHVLMINVSAGAKISATAGWEGSIKAKADSTTPCYTGPIGFTGLIISGVCYVTPDLSKDSDVPPKKGSLPNETELNSKKPSNVNVEETRTWEWIPPRYWLKEGERKPMW
jgi:hypothetical protein